jgi:hypothetical protein
MDNYANPIRGVSREQNAQRPDCKGRPTADLFLRARDQAAKFGAAAQLIGDLVDENVRTQAALDGAKGTIARQGETIARLERLMADQVATSYATMARLRKAENDRDVALARLHGPSVISRIDGKDITQWRGAALDAEKRLAFVRTAVDPDNTVQTVSVG